MAQSAVATIRGLLMDGAARLRGAGVHGPQLDAQLLLAHALGIDRTQLLARLPDKVPPDRAAAFEELIARRANREPLAYVLGTREFWGRPFSVRPGVLVPRPETELLVERALALATSERGVAVDLGTGSGALAVSFALELPGWRTYATDTSEDALAAAAQNAQAHGVARRVLFLRGSLLDPIRERADLVVANLPYVRSAEIEKLDTEVALWEPREALDGGEDGLDLIRELLRQLPEKTTPRAACLLELDPRQFPALEEEVRRSLPGWGVRRYADLTGRDRVAELRRFTAS